MDPICSSRAYNMIPISDSVYTLYTALLLIILNVAQVAYGKSSYCRPTVVPLPYAVTT